jgi:hydrogenase maturation protease
VVGIGNPLRGDDGIGIAVAEALRERVPAGVDVRRDSGDVARLVDLWRDARAVILVDAASAGSVPGTIHRFDASDARLPESVLSCSTHTFGVGEAIELARALGQLPDRVIVYGIEGERFDLGAGLSEVVDAGGEEAARLILGELERLSRGERDA